MASPSDARRVSGHGGRQGPRGSPLPRSAGYGPRQRRHHCEAPHGAEDAIPCRRRGRRSRADDRELTAWFEKNSNKFALPSRYSFRHVYFSPDARQDRAARRCQRAGKDRGPAEKSRLATSLADPFMFQDYYGDRAPEAFAKEFGPQFVVAFEKLKPGSWQGPIESGYGWHLVYVETVIPGRVPAFEEMEPDVKTAWLGEQKASLAQGLRGDACQVHRTLARTPRQRRYAVSGSRSEEASAPTVRRRAAVKLLGSRFMYLALGLLGVLLVATGAHAHESRPAYLEVKEVAAGQYDLLWRTPTLSGMRLPVVLQLPDEARNLKEPTTQELTDSVLTRYWIDAGPGGLAGEAHLFPGLQGTITDVLVRVELLDGRKWTVIVHPSQPWVEITVSQTRWTLRALLFFKESATFFSARTTCSSC